MTPAVVIFSILFLNVLTNLANAEYAGAFMDKLIFMGVNNMDTKSEHWDSDAPEWRIAAYGLNLEGMFK